MFTKYELYSFDIFSLISTKKLYLFFSSRFCGYMFKNYDFEYNDNEDEDLPYRALALCSECGDTNSVRNIFELESEFELTPTLIIEHAIIGYRPEVIDLLEREIYNPESSGVVEGHKMYDLGEFYHENSIDVARDHKIYPILSFLLAHEC